jgi:hypothetical protein
MIMTTTAPCLQWNLFLFIFVFQTIESIIAISTVLYNNKTLKALNINRPILFSQQEETTVHFAKLLKVMLKKISDKDTGPKFLSA